MLLSSIIFRLRESHSFDLQVLPRLLLLPCAELHLAERAQVRVEASVVLVCVEALATISADVVLCDGTLYPLVLWVLFFMFSYNICVLRNVVALVLLIVNSAAALVQATIAVFVLVHLPVGGGVAAEVLEYRR